MLQFDLLAGEKARVYGLDLVEFNNKGFVLAMRKLAKNILTQVSTVTTDDLRELTDKYGIQPDHQNAWGSIFRTKEFKIVGYTKSVITSNHARRIAVWSLA